VELNDAARRIVGLHWRLIATLVLVGIIVAAVAHVGDDKRYSASARLVIGSQDPKTQAEAASIADTAKAIATSPAVVRRALRRAGASNRDALNFARDDVSVDSVGASGVLQLRVTDGNPTRASAIANALTRQVIKARRRVTEGELRRVLTSVNPQIEELAGQIAELDGQSTLSSEHEAKRSSLVQQRTALESERFSALSAAAQQPKPAIISAATPPIDADSSNAPLDILLGALLGLILGVAAAGAIETFRPTLVGGAALARELNVPLLGSLPRVDDYRLDEAAPAVAGRLQLATRAAGVRNVGLIAVGPPEPDLPALARRFSLNGSNGSPKSRSGTVRPFDVRSALPSNGSTTTGLVLVSPEVLKKAELDEVKDLLRVSPGPLLGVLTYGDPGGP
jgi:capsular polysaccharide biosynthesis protein